MYRIVYTTQGKMAQNGFVLSTNRDRFAMSEHNAEAYYSSEYTVSIEFPKAKPLPPPNEDGFAPPSITRILEDETHWEARLDGADKIDCTVAVASGIITGLVDSFFIGKFSLERANEWGTEKVNQFVVAIAKLSGYKSDDLNGAIRHLEEKFEFAADGNTSDFGGGRQHHLRDFSHHFSLGGLLCSVFAQFTGKVIGTSTAGNLLIVDVPPTHVQFLGKSFPEKITFGTVSWVMHIASDIAGSSGNPGKGTGVPGPILSLIKQFSVLPIFKDAQSAVMKDRNEGLVFRELISKLFNGTLLKVRSNDGDAKPVRFDFRTELGMVHELGRQGIPVALNQCFVRSFYFIRRLTHEITALKITKFADLALIDPQDVLPFRNKAIARMSTISTGVFAGVNLADAAVRAAIISRGNKEVFLGEFVVRINFIGLGTFAVACALDIKGIVEERKSEKQDEAYKTYERELADLGCLELNPEQVRLLQSLQYAIVVQDIENTKQLRRKEAKRLWLNEWEAAIGQGLKERGIQISSYLLDTDALYSLFNKLVRNDRTKPWPYLVALEADLFIPYQPLGGESDDDFKGLKLVGDYMCDVFAMSQSVISKEDIKNLRKALKRAEADIDARIAKNTVKILGATVFAAATTIAAFVFAPYIAPVIAGEAVAGLSGAALTSASLAFVGGGALAAGGLGMAGGTAIIAGGGAVLGTIGGTSAAKIFSTMTNADGYVYLEATKLLCYCRDVLLDRFSDIEAVKHVRTLLNERILEMEITLESLKRTDNAIAFLESSTSETAIKTEGSASSKIDPKKQSKVLAKSIKYLKRCNSELAKAIAAALA